MRRDRPVSDSQQGFKDPENTEDYLKRLLEDSNEGFTFAHFAERYLKFELGVHIHWRFLPSVDAEQYCSIFNRATSGQCADTGTIVGIEAFERDRSARSAESDVGHPCRYEESVLVDVVEFVESPQRFIPSVVRTKRFDQVIGCCSDLLYSLVSGTLKGTDIFVDGELGLPIGDSIVGENQLVHQVIQARSDVMNSITENQQQTRRRYLGDTNSQRAISGFRIVVRDHFIGVTSVENLDFKLEIADVLCGSYNLCFD